MTYRARCSGQRVAAKHVARARMNRWLRSMRPEWDRTPASYPFVYAIRGEVDHIYEALRLVALPLASLRPPVFSIEVTT